jgi:hypothetical protein
MLRPATAGRTSDAPIDETGERSFQLPVALIILGIIVASIGLVVYFLALSDMTHSIGSLSTSNNDFLDILGVIEASCALMAMGGVVFLTGLVLLIVRSA